LGRHFGSAHLGRGENPKSILRGCQQAKALTTELPPADRPHTLSTPQPPPKLAKTPVNIGDLYFQNLA